MGLLDDSAVSAAQVELHGVQDTAALHARLAGPDQNCCRLSAPSNKPKRAVFTTVLFIVLLGRGVRDKAAVLPAHETCSGGLHALTWQCTPSGAVPLAARLV